MKNLLILFILLSLASCSSVQVSYDYDKSADFTKYKTYDYTEETKTLGGSNGQLIRQRLLSSVDQEMTSRGYTKSEGDADLLIELHIKAETRQTATAYNTGGYGFYRYGNMGTTTINYNEYTDGTLFINVVDKAADKLIWQGRGTKTLEENASPQKVDSNISYAVKTIYAKYPVKPAGTK
ncbi:MAG: DUF4136 domain-containing protein [Cyclobacteriaceae bacterium]|nr:DUF4136 domain-containing protein [Cyclobacteriaceae bacterium]